MFNFLCCPLSLAICWKTLLPFLRSSYKVLYCLLGRESSAILSAGVSIGTGASPPQSASPRPFQSYPKPKGNQTGTNKTNKKNKCSHNPSAMSVQRLQMNNHGPGPNLMKRTLRATRKRKPTSLEVFSLGLGVWMGYTTGVLRTG